MGAPRLGSRKCKMFGINYSPNCNCVYKSSDAEGMEMKSALRQLHLLCMKCLVFSYPASPPTSWGLVLLFSSHNSAVGLVTKKTHHKLPKIHRRKAFLSGMRTRDLPEWVCAPSLLCSTPMFTMRSACLRPAAQKWKILFTEQGCC